LPGSEDGSWASTTVGSVDFLTLVIVNPYSGGSLATVHLEGALREPPYRLW
jgi:hypothetical protein